MEQPDMKRVGLRLQVFADSDPGRGRELNEDAVLAVAGPGKAALLIVADGMGGHQAGEVASQLAVKTIRKALGDLIEREDIGSSNGHGLSHSEIEARLRAAVQQANLAILRYGLQHPQQAADLGSTVTCALIDGETAVIAHVGDSRAYHLRGETLRQVTADHSYVAELVRNGDLAAEHLHTHPMRNIITRALGQQAEVVVDVYTCLLKPGDRLLLCSDGLWEMIREADELADILRSAGSPGEAVRGLIEAANRYGGCDNIGVAVCEAVAV